MGTQPPSSSTITAGAPFPDIAKPHKTRNGIHDSDDLAFWQSIVDRLFAGHAHATSPEKATIGGSTQCPQASTVRLLPLLLGWSSPIEGENANWAMLATQCDLSFADVGRLQRVVSRGGGAAFGQNIWRTSTSAKGAHPESNRSAGDNAGEAANNANNKSRASVKSDGAADVSDTLSFGVQRTIHAGQERVARNAALQRLGTLWREAWVNNPKDSHNPWDEAMVPLVRGLRWACQYGEGHTQELPVDKESLCQCIEAIVDNRATQCASARYEASAYGRDDEAREDLASLLGGILLDSRHQPATAPSFHGRSFDTRHLASGGPEDEHAVVPKEGRTLQWSAMINQWAALWGRTDGFALAGGAPLWPGNAQANQRVSRLLAQWMVAGYENELRGAPYIWQHVKQSAQLEDAEVGVSSRSQAKGILRKLFR